MLAPISEITRGAVHIKPCPAPRLPLQDTVTCQDVDRRRGNSGSDNCLYVRS